MNCRSLSIGLGILVVVLMSGCGGNAERGTGKGCEPGTGRTVTSGFQVTLPKAPSIPAAQQVTSLKKRRSASDVMPAELGQRMRQTVRNLTYLPGEAPGDLISRLSLKTLRGPLTGMSLFLTPTTNGWVCLGFAAEKGMPVSCTPTLQTMESDGG